MTPNLCKLRTLVPLHELEEGAQQQIHDALALDFLELLAVMPDCHTGYTMPIGGVALLDGVISPEYVGYDIGCGMGALISAIPAATLKGRRQQIFKEVYDRIPVGFNCREGALDYPAFQSASWVKSLENKVNAKLNIQLGTLGSGNHFIEVGQTREGYLAITVHSGSRNIGHSIASFYMELSKLVDRDLPDGFLHLNGEYGRAYLQDMNFCLEYALANRAQMLREVAGLVWGHGDGFFINENHNHAVVQGGDKVLHRKGATPADMGQYGLIPGNMRDGVYVTTGLGNAEYLSSASHGAGRTMSRKRAKKELSLEEFQITMVDVVARVEQSTLDEAPFAYKNLDEVIARQDGIVVAVVDHIKPLINIKG